MTLRSESGRIVGMDGTMPVRRDNGTFDVEFDGESIASGFATEEDAWAWIDKEQGE